MDYMKYLKNFTIDIETIPTDKVGFYDIWEIRNDIEKLERNFDKLPLKIKQEYKNSLKKMYEIFNEIKSFDNNDKLVKKEVEFLKSFYYKHFNKTKKRVIAIDFSKNKMKNLSILKDKQAQKFSKNFYEKIT